MNMTVNDLIKKRGGVDEISDASKHTDTPVTADAVHKWRKNGIPEVHWPIFISSGVPVEAIYRANEIVRQKKNGAGDVSSRRRSSSRVAA